MRYFRDLLLTFASCALTLLLLEGALRLSNERFDAWILRPERVRGFGLRPNAEGWSVSEGDAYVRVNSDGMLDRERPFERPPDTLRIAVVGASNAENREVPYENTVENVMARQLSPSLERSGKHLDILNFGVYAYSLAQEYLTLRDQVWKYDPQIVVLVLDELVVLKNTLKTKPDDIGGEAPTYSVRDGQLVPDQPTPGLKALRSAPEPLESANQLWFTSLKNRVSLLSMASWARSRFILKRIAFKEDLHRYFGGNADTATASHAEQVAVWPYRTDVPEMQEDWAITEAFLREMKTQTDRHGAEFIVVVSDLPNQTQPSVEQREAFRQLHHLRSLDESDQRVQAMCGRLGIEVLTLGHPLGDYAATHAVRLHLHADNTGHWNKTGNEVAGHVIANELQAHSPTFRACEARRQEAVKAAPAARDGSSQPRAAQAARPTIN